MNPRPALLLMICATAFFCSGCVERTLTVASAPAGADVYIDGALHGKTPVDVPFTFYGTRKIRVELLGHETVTVDKKLTPPFYQWVPLDFFFENLVPVKMTDAHTLQVTLTPRPKLTPQEAADRMDAFLERAKALRGNGAALPSPTPESPQEPK